jgi:acetyl-CoA carboxylase carboxyltransferase component
MSWQEEIEAIEQRRDLLSRGADPIRLERALAQGKLRIRDRIGLLADPGSFRPRGGLSGGRAIHDERGDVVAIMPSGGMTGRCTVGGRGVVVTGNDSTTRQDGPKTEHWPAYHRRGTGRAENYAYHLRLPLVRVLDAPGASVRSYEGSGRPEVVWNVWADATTQLLSTVPVVSVVAGAAAGLPAIETCLGHFSVIVRGNGQAFPGGPPVVKVALGYEVSKEDLGGADLLAPIGVVDYVAADEAEAFAIVKRFLSYLPENAWQMPPRTAAGVEPAGDAGRLIAVVSEGEPRCYDPYKILDGVFDKGSVFEMGALAGPEGITAFARLDGYPVGVVIRNPNTPSAGALGVISTEKVARFVELCDTFHLPVVSFVDEPGAQGFDYRAGDGLRGIVRARAQLIQTIYHTSTPWISFVVGRAHGVAGSMTRRPRGFHRHYAWPSAYWESADGRGERLPAFPAMDLYGVDDMIDPRNTRQLLREFIESAQPIIATQLGPVTTRPAYRV